MRHHRIRAVAACAVLAVVAAACGGGSSSSSGSGSSGSASAGDCPISALNAAKGPVKVQFWYGGLGGKTLQTMKDSVAAFNASQSKVHVDAENEGQSYDEVLQKYKGAVKSKQLPSVVYLENTTLRAMVDSGTIVPAEACMKADGYDKSQILPAVQAYYSLNGQMWGGYANVSQPVLYFNKSLFTKAGLDPNTPPTNLEQLRTAAQKLKAVGVKAPLALSLKRWFWETWVTGEGIDVVNENDGRNGLATKSDVANPTTLKILNWMKQMQSEGLMQPIPNTPGNVDQYTALLKNSAMTLETSAASTTIAAFLKGDLSAQDLGASTTVPVDTSKITAGSGYFPGVTSAGRVAVNGGVFYIVNPKANGQDAATAAAGWEFLKFLLQKPQVTNWLKQGSYLPILKGIDQDPTVQAFFQDGPAGGTLLKVASDQLAKVDPRYSGPIIGPYTEYGKAIEDMLDSVMFNGADPTKAMNTAQTQVDAALQQYKSDNGG